MSTAVLAWQPPTSTSAIPVYNNKIIIIIIIKTFPIEVGLSYRFPPWCLSGAKQIVRADW